MLLTFSEREKKKSEIRILWQKKDNGLRIMKRKKNVGTYVYFWLDNHGDFSEGLNGFLIAFSDNTHIIRT